MYSSPTTPTGTGSPRPSRTYVRVPGNGRPIGTGPSSPSRSSERTAEVGAVDRRLGQAVGVDHPAAGSDEPAEPAVQTSAHSVGTDGQQPDAAQVFALSLEVGRQSVGERRHELEALDAFAPDEIGKCRRVEQDRTRASDERSAGGQGADPVAGEDVEGEAGGLEVSKRRPAQVVGVLPGGGGGEQAAVRDHDPLGPPGAAGGEDDIGEVLAIHAHRRIFGTLSGDGRPVGVEVDHVADVRGARLERLAVDDHDGDAGSVQHALQPRPWQGGLERHIRSACLEHAEHGHDLINGSVDDEADPDLGADALANGGNAPAGSHARSIRHRSAFRRRRPGPKRRVLRGPGPRTRRGWLTAQAESGMSPFRAVRGA